MLSDHATPTTTGRGVGATRDKRPIAALPSPEIGSRKAHERENREEAKPLRVPKAIWALLLLSGAFLVAGIIVLAMPA